MSVAIGDIVRISANFQWLVQDIFSNIFHFEVTRNDSVDDDDFMAQVADYIEDCYNFVNTDISTLLNYVDIEGINVTQDILLPPKLWPVLVNGNNTSAGLPTQDAACVFFRTLRPRTRASKFLPPYGQTANEAGGALVSAAVTRLQSYGDHLVTGMSTVDVDLRYGPYNVLLDRFTKAELAIVAGRYRTQRRRRLGVGS